MVRQGVERTVQQSVLDRLIDDQLIQEDPEIAEVEGVVSFGATRGGKREVIVTAESGEQKIYEIPVRKRLRVKEGDRVRAGDGLSETRLRAESIKTYKDSVRRDLEWLLNTRRIVRPVPDALDEVRRSLYCYGLPDITSVPAESPESRAFLMRQVEETLALFEPRLSEVRVSVAEEDKDDARHFRFLIEAVLAMEPSPEHVVFDTIMETASCKFEVR